MPRLSDSMEEGTIATWLVADGAQVSAGQAIVEIESDKATAPYEAEADGILRIVAPAGTTLRLGEPIARLESERTGGNGRPARHRPLASPVARRMASANDVDLAALDGTGANGRITKQDVVEALGREPAPAREPAQAETEDRRVEPTRAERLVAERMTASRREIPDITVGMEVDMAAALAFRDDLRAAVGEDGAVPSVNDLVVKATGLALARHPRVNSRWDGGAILEFAHVNVGVAVATGDGALVVPVLRDVDGRPLGAIAAEARELVGRARAGKASPRDFEGGTFTISNLGMMGVSAFTAVITPGQGAILAVGAAATRYVEVGGAPVARPVMTLTLNCDHRLIYGAHAAAFLQTLRRLLEHPAGLAL